MARKFTYKGKTFEELKNMSLEEFVSLLPSRLRRKFRRGLTEQEKIFLKNIRTKKKQVYRTHCRDMVVLPEFVGKKIGIYNGKEFVVVYITPEMIGRRLGELAITTKIVKHSGPGVGATRGSLHTSSKK